MGRGFMLFCVFVSFLFFIFYRFFSLERSALKRMSLCFCSLSSLPSCGPSGNGARIGGCRFRFFLLKRFSRAQTPSPRMVDQIWMMIKQKVCANHDGYLNPHCFNGGSNPRGCDTLSPGKQAAAAEEAERHCLPATGAWPQPHAAPAHGGCWETFVQFFLMVV